MSATSVTIEHYRAKRIVNVHKHADGWFWDKYSAHPYKGCEHACEYCYTREEKYYPYKDPADFSKVIKVKDNAAKLLRKELPKLKKDIIAVGDYQPVDKEMQLSRKMLTACLDFGFPAFVLEKSDLVLRDKDIIEKINRKSGAAVAFSIITTKEDEQIKTIEPGAPSIQRRLNAMRELADAGILTGTLFMPCLPFIYDSDQNIEGVVQQTAEHGGSFVLFGGLTLSDKQRNWYFAFLEKHYPDLVDRHKELYNGQYSPDWDYHAGLAKKVRQLCSKHGISDRMPRLVKYSPFPENLRLAEHLHNIVYGMELDREPQPNIWALRKAAWAVDDLNQSINQLYENKGGSGILAISGVGAMALQAIESWLQSGTKS
jgi:DNA repair photolyase